MPKETIAKAWKIIEDSLPPLPGGEASDLFKEMLKVMFERGYMEAVSNVMKAL